MNMHSKSVDLALLLLRISFGVHLAWLHGWGKLQKLLAGDRGFRDPLGIGNLYSLIGATTTEFLCGILLALGLFVRPAAVGVGFTMSVAAFVVHASDPWKRRELALLYLTAALVLLLTGPGRYSLNRPFHAIIARVFGNGFVGRLLTRLS